MARSSSHRAHCFASSDVAGTAASIDGRRSSAASDRIEATPGSKLWLDDEEPSEGDGGDLIADAPTSEKGLLKLPPVVEEPMAPSEGDKGEFRPALPGRANIARLMPRGRVDAEPGVAEAMSARELRGSDPGVAGCVGVAADGEDDSIGERSRLELLRSKGEGGLEAGVPDMVRCSGSNGDTMLAVVGSASESAVDAPAMTNRSCVCPACFAGMWKSVLQSAQYAAFLQLVHCTVASTSSHKLHRGIFATATVPPAAVLDAGFAGVDTAATTADPAAAAAPPAVRGLPSMSVSAWPRVLAVARDESNESSEHSASVR